MAGYVIRRLLWLPLILLIVSFFTFGIARFGPGDPVSVAAGQIRDEAILQQIREDRGLDGSIFEQYLRWGQGAIRGDFGESLQQRGFTVSEVIFPRMWVSAQLGFIARCFCCGGQMSQTLLKFREWEKCCCSSHLAINGPLWLGPLQSEDVLNKMKT